MAATKRERLKAEGLWDYALKVLSRRAHSSSELRYKLLRRAESPAFVQITMDKLREYGLADDAKFSEAFAQSRLQNQGFGRQRVLRDLRSKRVPVEIAKSAVEKTFGGVAEAELIQQFLERKYRGKDLKTFLKIEKNFAGAYRRLRLAGFTSAASISILKRYAAGPSDWDMPVEEDDQL